MTNSELEKLARLQAEFLANELMNNRQLLDRVFPPKYMDVAEAAAYLRVPQGTIYHKSAEIPHSVIGKRLLFSQRDLDDYARGLRCTDN